MSYLILFLSAFGAATLLPLSSEVTLVALLSQPHSALLLWLVATSGNTLGSVVNWVCGKYFVHFKSRSWFPFSASALLRSQNWFQRYGVWTLLFAWLPVVGDGLTFVAGVMRVRFVWFFLLTAFGKAVRYAVVIAVFYDVTDAAITYL